MFSYLKKLWWIFPSSRVDVLEMGQDGQETDGIVSRAEDKQLCSPDWDLVILDAY